MTHKHAKGNQTSQYVESYSRYKYCVEISWLSKLGCFFFVAFVHLKKRLLPPENHRVIAAFAAESARYLNL